MNKCKQCDTVLLKRNLTFCSKRCSCLYKNLYNHSTKGKGKGKPMCLVDGCKNHAVSYSHKHCRSCIDAKQMRLYTKNPTKGELVNKYIKKNHRSSAYSYIRWHAREVVLKNTDSKSCCRCGYSKHVEVCHIKSIQSFDNDCTIEQINHIDNLILLCPNCHWENDNLY